MTESEQLALAQARLNKNLTLKEDIQNILNELTQQYQQLSDEMQAQLLELTKLEMEKANFIGHSFGIYNDVKIDKDDNTIFHFDEYGHMEAAIATELDSWKDSSHVTLHVKVG